MSWLFWPDFVRLHCSALQSFGEPVAGYFGSSTSSSSGYFKYFWLLFISMQYYKCKLITRKLSDTLNLEEVFKSSEKFIGIKSF